MILCGWILMFPTYLAWPSIQLSPAAGPNRVTDIALAIAVGVPLLIGILFILAAFRWILLAAWPRPLRITVDPDALILDIGPFKKRELRWRDMDASYSYEREDDPDDEPDPELLALEPEEEMEAHLPRMRHPKVDGDVRWLLLRFAAAGEAEIARVIHPYILQGRRPRARHDDSPSHDNPEDAS